MQLEIEQKYRLSDPTALAARLSALSVVLAAPLRQIDTYLQHPVRDFRQTDEAFRLRQVGDVNYLTYKGPKLDSTTKTRRELEIAIATGSSAAAQFLEMFAALGFAPAGQVSKSRRATSLDWSGWSVEIAWDDVDGLGNYLELEIIASEAELADAREALRTLAEQLGLQDSDRGSYLELLAIRNKTT